MQKDYIMRMVEQFAQAIASIICHRKSENYQEAQVLVQTTGRYLLRMDFNLLLCYNHAEIMEHFKDFSKCFETEKCVLGADLFYELALIEEAQQRLEAALRLKILSLHLYTIGIPKELQFQESYYFGKISSLIDELKNQRLPEEVRINLRDYEGFIAQRKMENIIFILIDEFLSSNSIFYATYNSPVNVLRCGVHHD